MSDNEPSTRSGQPAAPSGLSAPSRWLTRMRRLKGVIVPAAGVGAVLSGLVGYWNAYHTLHQVAANGASAGAQTAEVHPLSLAVAPFVNSTADAQLASYVDSLGDSVAAGLNKAPVQDVRVMPLRDRPGVGDRVPASPEQIGRERKVHFVLDGTLQKTGDIGRLTLRLTNAATGVQVWSDTLQGALSDPLSLADQAGHQAPRIVTEMVREATREIQARKGTPTVPELFVQAVAQTLLNPQAAAAAQRTTELYRQIVEREPDNVRALDGLAIALVTEVSIALEVEDEPDRDVLARKIDEAEALALKAKGIGGDSAYDLQFILANTAQFRGDHAGMQAAYAASLEQSPQFDAAYVNLAQAHLLGGDPSRAIALLEKALAIEGREPSDIPLTAMGFAHLMQGDATRAVAVLQRSRIVNPADPTIYALLALANAELNHGAAVQAAKDELRRVAPSYSFRRFERTYKPMITAPEPYRNWWTTRLMPLWSRAGLPGLVQ